MNQSKIVRTKGSQSEIGMIYQYGVTALLAGGLSTSERVEDYVIYSSEESAGKFDDVIARVKLKDEDEWYLSLIQVKYKEAKKLNVSDNLKEKSRGKTVEYFLSDYIRSFNKIVDDSATTCRKDIPSGNIRCGIFCDKEIQLPVFIRDECTFLLKIKDHRETDDIHQILLPFGDKFWKFDCDDLKRTPEFQRFFDTCTLCLKQPNYNQINKNIQDACGIDNAKDIVNYVKDYFNNDYLYGQGLRKVVFDMELQKIRLNSFIPPVTPLVNLVEDIRVEVWNRITLEHDLTIINNNDDSEIERCLYGCLLLKLNILLDMNIDWTNYVFTNKELDPIIVTQFLSYSKKQEYRCWVNVPNTLKGLMAEVWKYGELPLILRMGAEFKIFEKYSHLKRSYILIDDLTKLSEQIAKSELKIFRCIGDISDLHLKDSMLNNTTVSLQGRLEITLKNLLDDDEELMSTFTAAHIIGMMKDRTAYLKEEYLAGTKNLAFVVHDNSYPEIKICHDSPAIGSNARIYCPGGKLQQCFAQIENDPNFRDYKICQLQRIKNDLKLIRHDKYKFVCWFMDQHGEPLYNSEDNKSVPVIGQIVVLEEFNYVPRCLTKSTISLSYFLSDNQEKQICLISGDAESMREQLEYEQDDIGIDAEDVANIFTEKRTYFIRVKDEEERQHYWIKLSGLGCPVFDIKIINGEMQITRRCNGLKHLGASIAYKGERITQQVLFEEMKNERDNIIIITGEAGVGKSTLLKSLCNSCDSRYYVLLYDLINFQICLHENENPLSDPLDFIFKSFHAGISKRYNEFLLALCKKHRFILMLDSFDEIISTCEKQVIDFIQHIIATGVQIIIASRFKSSNVLLEKFNARTIKVDPLSDEDYLESWKLNREAFANVPVEFRVSPLYLNLLKMISVSQEELPNVTKFTLYEKVVNIKIGSWLKRNNRVLHDSEIERTVSLFERLALVAMFGREEIQDGLRWLCDKSIADCTKYGIVVRFDEAASPLFYHYTFVEYFVAQWIFKAMQTKIYRGFAKYLYKRLFDEGKMSALNVISEDVPLHRAILQTNLEEMEAILRAEAPNCWETTDKLGRSALHAAIISCGSTHNLDSAYVILEKVMTNIMVRRPEIMEKCDLVMNWYWADYIQAKTLQYGCSFKTLPMVETYLQTVQKQEGHNNSIFPLKKFQAVFKEALGFLSSDIISQLLRLQNVQNRKFQKFQQNGLAPKFSVNGFKLDGELSPLHVASIYANVPLMENLIANNNVDVNAIDKFDCTPLHYILMGSSPSHLDGLKLLLKNGAHIDLQHPSSNRSSVPPITIAVHAKNTEAVRILLENGANPNIHGGRMLDTPLHVATKQGSYELVECLLDYDGNPNLKNRNGKTVLDIAGGNTRNDENIIRMLKERSGNVTDENGSQNSLLTIAAKAKQVITLIQDVKSSAGNGAEDTKIDFTDQEDHYDYCNDFHNINCFLENGENSNSLSLLFILNEINIKSNSMNLARLMLNNQGIELILEMGLNSHKIQDEDGCTLLHLVAGEGDEKLTKLLLEKDAEIDVQDRQGLTPLHYAAMKNCLNTASLLLLTPEGGKGANPNIQDKNGDTPLHLSAKNNYIHMTELLLANGAVCNVENEDGRTPLYFAVLTGNANIVRLLLDDAADVHIFDNNGLTPLHFSDDVAVLKLLLQRGCDANIVNKENEVLPLICAIYRGNYDAIKTLILTGKARLDLADKNGNLPLHAAIDRKSIEIVQFLLSKGAQVNAANKDGVTALYCATYKKQPYIMDLLLRNGADINVRNSNLETSLHCAVSTARLDTVKILLDNKCDPNLQDNHGKTPLHIAATNGYTDIVEMLIQEHSVNINLADEDGITPLHCAVFTGRNGIVKLLADSQAVLDVKEKSGKTALYTAVEEGNLDLVKLLLQKQESLVNVANNYNSTPLHCALTENHLEIATLLIDKSASINMRDKNDDTPLHLAVKQEEPDIVAKLLDNGANIDAVNKDDVTPLYFAAQEGHLDVTRLLLMRDAVINVQDYRGNTPLHIATTEGNSDIVKLLMSKGADANITNTNKTTPLHYATEKGHTNIVRQLLLNHKTDSNFTGENDNTPLHAATGRGYTYIVRILLEEGAHPSPVNKDGCTPLHYAAEEGYSDIVRLLLDGNASTNVRNKVADTPLHLAVNRGNVDNIIMLLNNGANVNFDDQYGGTPLHSATSQGRADIVKLLLEKRGNPNSQNDQGDTPLHLSVRDENRTDIFEMLVEKGAELSLSNRIGLTPLHYVAFKGRLDMVKTRLERDVCEKIGHSLLFCAVIGGHADFIRGLLEKGANINDSDENGVTPLHCAVIKENVDFTALLLEKGARVNAQDIRGNAPLHIAVHKLCTTLVKLLLDWKADVNCGDKNGVLPLHIGAYKGDINIVDLLLNKNGDINAQDALQGNTALHVCAEAGYGDIFKLLLEKGANPSFYNKEEGITPFHYAAAKGYLHIIEACELDADILMNIPDSSDNTLLHTAANYGRDTVLEWLLTEGVDVNVMNQHCSTPLHFAVYSNHLSSARLLLLQKEVDVNMKDQDGNTALHLATVRGNFDVVQLLLEVEGCDVNIANKQGVTPLQYSIVKQHDAITVMLLENNRTVEVNVRDNDGSTPLHFSVSADNLDLVKLLLDKGAHADISNNNLVTSLHIAVLKRLEDVIKLMLSNKRIDVNVIDAEGNTPLHLTLMIERQPSFELISNRDDSIFNYYEGNIIKPISYNIDDDDYIGIGKLFANDNDGNVTSSSSTNNTVRNTEIIYKPEADQLAIDEDHDKEDTLTFNFIFKQLKEESSLIEDTDTYCELLKIVDKNGETENSASYLPIINMIKGLIRGIFKQSSLAADLQNIIIPVTISARIQRDDVPTILFQLQNVGKTHQYFTCETNLKSRNPSISLFLSRGLNENSDTKSENHLSIVEYGTKKCNETSINTSDSRKFDILNVIKLFLDNGASVNIQNKLGNTLLHLAVENQNMEVVKLLLSNDKSNINMANENGIVPLHQAICSGQNMDLIRLLVEEGADVNFRNKTGKTPFQLASETGNLDIVGLLLEKGAKATMECTSSSQNA